MKQPYHVLSVVGNLGFGGDEYRLAAILRSMDPNKFRFTVIVLPHDDGADALFGTMQPQIEAEGARVLHLENPSTPEWLPPAGRAVVRLVRKVMALARLIHELEVDLVDARLNAGMYTGVLASVVAAKPSVSTLYDSVPWEKSRLWWLFRAVTINLTRAVITDSSVRQAELNRWIWIRPRNTFNIPNGIAIPVSTRSSPDVRHELGIPNEPEMRIIGQISAIVPYKGQMVLLDAARTVLNSDPHAFFLMVGYSRGQEQYLQRLRDRSVELGIAERVCICSYPGVIGDIWQLIDIHVHASIFDSLPNAILEGMALGKPAVVTAVGGIPEAVENEKTGLVVPINDPEALAQALLRLLRDPAKAKAMGQGARQRHHERYRTATMAQALEDCYESVLNPSAHRHIRASHTRSWGH
ncbi:MAG: glycosyltransferase [Terracidiphilus sp.]